MGSTASVSPSNSEEPTKKTSVSLASNRSSTLLYSPASSASSSGSAHAHQNFDKVREAFDVLQFQNIDVDRSTPVAYNKWARAEYMLKKNPELMINFIKMTKKMYAKEHEQLYKTAKEARSITKSAVKEHERLYQTPVDDEFVKSLTPSSLNNTRSVLDSLLESKNTPPGSEVKRKRDSKTRHSLANLVLAKREAIKLGEKHETNLSLTEQLKIEDEVNSQVLSDRSGISTKASSRSGRPSTNISLHPENLYDIKNDDQVATPPIANAHPVNGDRVFFSERNPITSSD